MIKEKFLTTLLLPLLMLIAAVYAYANSFSGQFIYDDYISIVDNPGIRSLGASLQHTSRPLTNLTFALNYQLGNKTADYHLVNLIIHLANMLLLYGIICRTLKIRAVTLHSIGHPAILAGLIALLWAVHPLQTESVTYIVQRAESLMAMFFLATLYFALLGFTSMNSLPFLVLSCVSCSLGMLAKPVMITAPLMVLCYDRFFISGSMMAALKRRLPFYVGLACSWLVLAVLLAQPNESTTSAGFGRLAVTPLQYLATQSGVILHYLRLAIWPVGLCLDYAWEPVSSIGAALLPSLFIGFLLMGTAWGILRNKPVGFLGVWFFLILMPTSSFIPLNDCAAEHRMYLPLAAVIVCAVMCDSPAFKRRGASSRMMTVSTVLVFAPILALLVAMTVARNADYQSDLGMWQRVLDVRPDNIRAYFGKGSALLKAGRHDKAEACFKEVLKRVPNEEEAKRRGALTDYALVLNNMGVIAYDRNDLAAAETYFLKSSTLVKGNSGAENNLATVRQEMLRRK